MLKHHCCSLLAVLLWALALFAAPPSVVAKPPNILWLVGENLSHDLGCYGAQHVHTPNLDRLAAEGVRFTHAFATNPACAPKSTSRSFFKHAVALGYFAS
ncbi:MAG TPA: sulfatase-like hydrolase/transferase [Pirellulales bacterium]|nr:sulfatase-like hydrolase/transferase [Pirellulales bacterium]